MVRKTYSALVAVVLAALVMVGCGNEDVSDLATTWTGKEGDVQTKLAGVMAKHAELQGKFQALPAANPADTTAAADRTMAGTMLQDHQTKVAELEAKIKTHMTKREELMATPGSRADYEAAWKSAEADYEAALTSLNEIESQLGDVSSRLDNLSKPAAMPTTTDTAAVGSTTKTDTAKASSSTTTDTTKK